MDRNEAVLRELNLYPLWKRRAPAPDLPSCPELAAACPSAGSVLSEIKDVHCDSSVAVAAVQVDNLDWPELKQRVSACTACRLRADSTQTVFGVGDAQAEWLFVGEGPGAEEDAQGEPFMGQSGKLLDNMLLAIGLKRGKNVYLANVVKCRPPNDARPKVDEIATCLPYLQRQIELIKPRIIIALGKTAATALLGRDVPLGTLRGTLHEFNDIPLIVTYHPAYLLRSPMEKAKVWQDLCLAVSMVAG